ncbi:hypothetical protein Taro_035038 [Colocasia esculenta]|uniref:Uncharacterized protein n=1 Tax=Colocasia esculenta TaxID=4460 RepID=A0A843W4K4_COLES|nr:hypothetical protein [Colocasia esculenta]
MLRWLQVVTHIVARGDRDSDYFATGYPHTLCLGGICSCSLDGWLYNFCSKLGVENMDVGSPPENIVDRNKAKWAHQSMPYRKGKKSHYQLSDDFERMIQLSATSLDSESGSTPISAEEAFVSVMGKDRSSRIRCGGSRETHRTWYGIGEGSSSSDYQQQINNIENTLRIEVEKLRTEARRWDLGMDEMRRELE